MSECSPQKQTDVYGEHVSYERALGCHWKTGTKLIRTVFAVAPDGWERLIGTMDTPQLAEHVVRIHNQTLQAQGLY